MHSSLGPAIGKAYVPGKGVATVFATENKDRFDLQIDRTGVRVSRLRDTFQWRKNKQRSNA